jgi:2-oxoglutarate ferredoxin oxidoreductase subunit beta
MEFFEFYRRERWPTIFCPGCGIGIVMNALYRALDELNVDLDKVVFVSGIGCTGRVPGYINADSLHTTHGRPLAYATGIKLANPDLDVVVISGDGDLGAIGGNHLIHAARRNVDMTVIAVTNFIYGLTGGQVSPTTPHKMLSTTTPYGNWEYPFSLALLVAASGANYVARWTTSHPYQLKNAIKEAFETPGFSFVEVLSQCPENFGRRNRIADPPTLMRWMRERTMPLKDVMEEVSSPLELVDLNITGRFAIGKFVRRKRKTHGQLLRGEEDSLESLRG